MLHLLLLLAVAFPGDAGPASHSALTLSTEGPTPALAIDRAAFAPTPDGATLVFVRHAETEDDGTRDPALSEEGRARAARLAELLADAGVTEVWSTDLRRTRGTAAPLAEAAGVEVAVYDPFDPGALAERIADSSGTVVVVGHSNTTPAFVDAFGGTAGPPIAEDEYDRIYVLLPGSDGAAPRTLRLGY